jgi:hypothetical protein
MSACGKAAKTAAARPPAAVVRQLHDDSGCPPLFVATEGAMPSAASVRAAPCSDVELCSNDEPRSGVESGSDDEPHSGDKPRSDVEPRSGVESGSDDEPHSGDKPRSDVEPRSGVESGSDAIRVWPALHCLPPPSTAAVTDLASQCA